MDALTIRETFLQFFEDREHRRYASAPLIPNDPSLLLTIAGMVPFKPYFTGDAIPPVRRIVSHQKCVRTNDIDNVGRTTRHLSFFEMLGNFSFGDYFKHEAIRWAWELSTDSFGLEPDRIWVSIHESDDEAEQFWLQETDVPAERIVRMGQDNFWDTGGAGPCGPCTELHYDRGEQWGAEGGPAVNGERYLEFYNLVFMQYLRDDAGTILGDLPQQNVDTGLGLERMAVLKQGVNDVFATDLLAPLVQRATNLTGVEYGANESTDVSLRVIAEHARAAAFLIGDGVLPAKEGRGYVLRRLLRRAVRHGQVLGGRTDTGALIVPMVEAVIEHFTPMYPDLVQQRALITRVAGAEEKDFGTRIRSGLERVEGVIDALTGAEAPQAFPGAAAFELHDTYGFPIDLTAEIVAEAGLDLDRAAFDDLMSQQRERARAGARRKGDGVPDDVYRRAASVVGVTEFVGYDQLDVEASLGAIVTPDGLLSAADEGDEIEIVLARTPFYPEGGGQIGDAGTVETVTGRLEILDTQEVISGLVVHRARVAAGEITTGQELRAQVDQQRRTATARSHSATHVLNATIRQHLGEHAQQAGSLVQPGRLRYDFPHFEAVSRDRLEELEASMNARVLANPHVTTEVMSLDDAKKSGAVANFGDKYSDVVRVVSIGSFSRELCGGTHVPTGATIGSIVIVREESIGANTRRIEALTGLDARQHLASERLVAEEIGRLLEVPTDQAVARVSGLIERLRRAERELATIRGAQLSQQANVLANQTDRVNGLAIMVAQLDEVTMDDLRRVALQARDVLRENAVVVVATATSDGKAQMVCAVSKDLAEQGHQARTFLQPLAAMVGGGAGGKGDVAQAGGKEVAVLPDVIAQAGPSIRRILDVQ